ncbi:MAG: RNA polymerase sigma-70 factor [Prolixibacteraceae bacterium]
MRVPGVFDERFLVLQLQHDDRKVFEVIFKFYYSGLVLYADRIIHNTEMSEDVVQSVFMRLWEDRKNLAVHSLKSYLGAAVKNRSIDLVRNQKVRNKYRDYVQENDQEQDDDFYTFHELSQVINQAVEKLPPRCREIFLMSRFQHLRTNDIALKLNITKRTVETQISHALRILRVELKDYLYLFLILSELFSE